jgi:uncharacterized membrane protein YphA (DoxX/SURF4 family)
MRTNPFNDTWLFLIGETDDYNALGLWKYFFVALFLALLAASIVIAIRNWREDPTQRTGTHLATWFMRVLVGTMWFGGMLWKLPWFSEENGLYYWMEQMAGRAAFEVHRELVANVFLPYFNVFNPIVFLAELLFATCLILGFCVRIVAVAAVLFTLHLWLGLYIQRAGDPEEWPWSYIFLAMVLAFLAIHAAGRSLGLDALLRRHLVGPPARPGGIARLYRAVS